MSVNAVTNSGGKVLFSNNEGYIAKDTILTGQKQKHGLYSINFFKRNENEIESQSLLTEKKLDLIEQNIRSHDYSKCVHL